MGSKVYKLYEMKNKLRVIPGPKDKKNRDINKEGA
jgi:hypothetical protein